jgi:DNA primase
MHSILDLLKEDGIELKRVANTNGGEYASPCPGCGGKDRFRSWPFRGEGGRWWCRKCGKSGDLIQYLRDFRGMRFRESCHFLGQDPSALCCRLHFGTTENVWKPDATTSPPEKWQSNAMAFLKAAEKELWSPENREIRTWLKRRGLEKKIIKQSHLGWNPRNICYDREKWGLQKKIKENGSLSKIWIPAGLAIPCFRDDLIQKIQIRRSKSGNFDAPPEQGGRYVLVAGSSGKVPVILGNHNNYFVVVESDLDAILLHQEAEDIVSTVSLGSAANKPDKEINDFLKQAETILVALDTDEAGKKSAWNWWMAHFPKAKRWPVPGGKDPGEAYEKGIDLRKWIRAGLPDHIVCLEDLVAPTEDESPTIEEFL